nr:cox cluster protein [Natronomonas sp. LN261]
MYVIVVGVTGFMGAAIGSIGLRDLEAVSFLGLVTFQPTPVGLAAYGMTLVGVVLGVLLALVVFVSRRYVDA